MLMQGRAESEVMLETWHWGAWQCLAKELSGSSQAPSMLMLPSTLMLVVYSLPSLHVNATLDGYPPHSPPS